MEISTVSELYPVSHISEVRCPSKEFSPHMGLRVTARKFDPVARLSRSFNQHLPILRLLKGKSIQFPILSSGHAVHERARVMYNSLNYPVVRGSEGGHVTRSSDAPTYLYMTSLHFCFSTRAISKMGFTVAVQISEHS